MQRVSTERVCYRGNTVNIKHSGTNHIFRVDRKIERKFSLFLKIILTFIVIMAIIINERRLRMVRSINFSDELYERLQKIAKDKEISISALIKMACKEYVVREERQQEEKQ